MDVTYSTNAWGMVTAHCCGANNVNYAYYIATGEDKTAIKEIAEAGFESIEMFDGNLLAYEEKIDSLKELLEQYRLGFRAVYSAANFIYDEILEEEYGKIMRTARIAQKLGARHLVLGGGAIRQDGIQESDYRKLGKALDEISRRAEDIGLTTSFHPHMGSLVERIKYFHLKGVNENGVFCALDQGEIDFGPILKLLKGCKRKIELAVECDANSSEPGQDARATARYLAEHGMK